MEKNKTLDHKCPSCGAYIHFKPNLGKWKCEYCDSSFTLEELQKYNNASSIENNTSKETDDNNNENTNYTSYTCKDCGAEIITDENTSATFCIYCGNTAILKNKLSGKFAPDKIIPFKTEKEDAIKAFQKLSKGRPLMPKFFNKAENIEKIRGIYIPFWLFDDTVSGELNLDATNITSWRSGNYIYTKTDLYKITRNGSVSFKGIPIDGSKRFDDAMMNSIEPYNYKELTDYNHAYLSGFLAEKYDVDSEVAFRYAYNRSVISTREEMLKNTKRYTTSTITNDTLKTIRDDVKYALLPVWMVNVKYKDKMYLFAMNGQTGEIIGDIPLDKKKQLLYTIGIFLGVFLGIILISLIYFLMTGGKL